MSGLWRGVGIGRRSVAGITAALWLAGTLAVACIQGSAPSNLALTVANGRAEEATFEWRSGGLLGTGIFASGGIEPIGGCERHGRSFGPGHHVVTITSGEQVLPLSFDVAEFDQAKAYVLIDSGGSIRQVSERDMPKDSQCGTADPSG